MFLLFHIPFFYTFNSRIDNLYKRLSWFFIYLIPVVFSPSFISINHINTANLILAILGVVIIYNFYEIGYIYNDTETTKNELNPTIRLTNKQLMFYEKNKKSIYLSRLLLGISLNLIILITLKTYLFFLSSSLILLFFIIYNNMRNNLNLIIHFILSSLRFCTIPLLFTMHSNQIEIIVYMIILFPLLNTLERSHEEKFKFKKRLNHRITNSADGRYYYYLILTISSLIVIFIKNLFNLPYIYSSIVFFIYSIYFFTYRYFSYKFSLVYRL